MPMTWPGPDGTNLISLSFQPADGTGEVLTSETGAWAWLRLSVGSLLAGKMPFCGALGSSSQWQAEFEAYQRAQAVVMLNDIADRVASNRDAAAAYRRALERGAWAVPCGAWVTSRRSGS